MKNISFLAKFFVFGGEIFYIFKQACFHNVLHIFRRMKHKYLFFSGAMSHRKLPP